MSDNIEVGTAWQRKCGAVVAVVTATNDEYVKVTMIFGGDYTRIRITKKYFLNWYTQLPESM